MELIILFERKNKMDKEIRNLLEEEIKAEILDLSALSTGSEEKSSAIEDLAKLYKLKIEETKTVLDYGENYKRDERLKSEQEKDRYFKYGIEVAGIVLPLIFYAVWMNKGFRFEENGTFTSTTFRGLFNRFKPTKK